MGILKIAICDDEILFAEKLRKIIGLYCMEKQYSCEVDIYQSGREFIGDKTRIMEYQIIFLDINMKDLDGLETARELRKVCRHTFLIFVTAYIDYTIEGYKVEAIRYLLKSNSEFEQSVYESLDAVFQKIEYTPVVKSFCFREGNINIAMEKVVFVESDLHKLYFYILDGEIITYSMYDTLNNISKEFDENFIRIHQSYLVNLRFIKKIDGSTVVLSNGLIVPVTRSKLRAVRNSIAKYKGRV